MKIMGLRLLLQIRNHQNILTWPVQGILLQKSGTYKIVTDQLQITITIILLIPSKMASVLLFLIRKGYADQELYPELLPQLLQPGMKMEELLMLFIMSHSQVTGLHFKVQGVQHGRMVMTAAKPLLP